MFRFTLSVVLAALAGGLVAAPVPSGPEAKALVAGLSDPSPKVRDEAARALEGRADASPWLRRATRSQDKDTARRAAALLTPYGRERQKAAAKAIDYCIQKNRIDLFMEWFHYWQPASPDDLWRVGPLAAKTGLALYDHWHPKEQPNHLVAEMAALAASDKHFFFDGSEGRQENSGVWHIRAERLQTSYSGIAFASTAGPITHHWMAARGRYFALGPFCVNWINCSFICADGEVRREPNDPSVPPGVRVQKSVAVCRGNFYGRMVAEAVVLVDGDVDLSDVDTLDRSLIRATGEVKLPKGVKPVDCTIEAHAKKATAPYSFFEVADVGLSLTDDEEGLVVSGVKADTPFGNSGIRKGDLIRAIDDVPAGHSEEFRKKLRRAIVRQGDCLITVARDDKTLDLPVFFPLPK